MRDLALVFMLFFSIYYAFKRPYIGVCAWVWIALTAPTDWAFGFSTQFRMNLTIVLVTVLAYIFSQKNKSLKGGSLGLLTFLFGFWTLISSYNNITIYPSQVWGHWFEFVKVLMLFLFVLLTIQKRLHIDTFIWAIVLSISSFAASGAFKFLVSGGSYRIVGVAGQIQDRNDLVVAINMCIPLIIYLAQTCKHANLKKGLWGLLILNIIAVVGTYSRAGFVGLLIIGAAFWWKSKSKFKIALLAMCLIPVFYALAPSDWKARQSTVETAATQDSSFIGRLWAWKISTMIALDHPFTGGGFRAVIDPSIWSYYAPATPDFPPIDTPPIPDTQHSLAAHNIYMQVLGDHGFIGLGIFLLIFYRALSINKATLKLAKQNGHLWGVHLSSALSLSIIGFCINGANVSRAYFDLVWAILAIIVVVQVNRASLFANTQTSTQETTPDGRQITKPSSD
ncbi:putative O-glycosylation ligase, exosortase A system-associated [Neptunicella marina]|uniref:Putative O-glycosylation ligase, exosortase A system-associated n=1 Tax=Neptunicella marina TaxID=2125989 RepID=A0A8J6IUK7_9ALTE|nr:putative O-glycosylation ligase, exosortase A system-associated [Neptunicella marina]MBC3765763.1 putative O-glycosylation ligase, exosortase A system-associated [Neptunicella marina]